MNESPRQGRMTQGRGGGAHDPVPLSLPRLERMDCLIACLCRDLPVCLCLDPPVCVRLSPPVCVRVCRGKVCCIKFKGHHRRIYLITLGTEFDSFVQLIVLDFISCESCFPVKKSHVIPTSCISNDITFSSQCMRNEGVH